MTPAERLSSYLDALRPIIYIHNFDFAAVDDLITRAVRNEILIEEYNNASGKVNFNTKIPTSILGESFQNDSVSMATIATTNKLITFLENSITDCSIKKIMVLKDVHNELAEPAIIAQIKAISLRTMYVDDYWIPIIIVSSKLVIPPELEKLITVFDIPYPDLDEINKILTEYSDFGKFAIAEEDRIKLALAFKGLSEFEITQILNLAYQRSGSISIADKELILREKEQSIKKSGLLEAVPISSKIDDIGGLENAKQELIEAVEWPLKYPELFSTINIKPPRGVLLFGPPGTGKTLLAKAVASESEANFISIKGPELLSKYVGESERAVRETFRKAKQAAPTVVFFDEIDSIAPQRSSVSDTHVSERVVSQILTELDGVEEFKDVVIVAATNRPDMVDPALLRPGRFDRLIYIKPPDNTSREKIFEIHTQGKPLAEDVNLAELADMTEGYVGADIQGICREAAMLALREIVTPGAGRKDLAKRAGEVRISKKHFERAIRRVKPTTSRENLVAYERSAELFAKYATEFEEEAPESEEQEKEIEHENVPGFFQAQ